jgi:UDP:flavonoid glycosyltransferase YjiC (YdhE family)
MSVKQRLLFVAENVTLAQVVRLVALARDLDPDRYEIHFACSEFPELVFSRTPFICHPLATLAADAAARALQAGRRLYEKSTLLRYIDAEIELIRRVGPALVIGDFRLSLPTSAELCGVPSAVLINAYWSPFARRERFPVPDHPIIKWLGEALTEQYFPQAIPRVFQHFASPVNAARKKHRLPPVGSLLEVLTHADYTLYPDDPWLTPLLDGAPESHRFLGPVSWQPELLEEAWSPSARRLWEAALRDPARPLVYVTLGSSGEVRLLPMILEALARLPIIAIVATAGRVELADVPANVAAVPFVRGQEVARRARVVVSNGGSTTGYQALAQGTPVVGLPSNFDQYLAMQAIVAAGAGVLIKARQASASAIEAALASVLADTELRAAAGRVAQRFASHDASATFRRFVAEVSSAGQPALTAKNTGS